MDTGFIDHQAIEETLRDTSAPDKKELSEILAHARELKGISYREAERLLMVEADDDLQALFDTANFIKNEIYGRRMVLFAPLYVSNMCNNECLYCAFRRSNTQIPRRTLTIQEIRREAEALVRGVPASRMRRVSAASTARWYAR